MRGRFVMPDSVSSRAAAPTPGLAWLEHAFYRGLMPSPPICPYGHPLIPGRVLVGWAPCICPSAWKHHGGHRTYQCLDCLDRRITSRRYVPEHLGGGHPGR